MAMMSCSIHEAESPKGDYYEGQQLVFTGGFGDVETKSAIQPDGTSIWWNRGDDICIYYGLSEGNHFIASDDEDEFSYAHFTGQLTAFTGQDGQGNPNYFWAVYPYEASSSFDGQSLQVNLSAEQTAKAGSFANRTNISIAKSLGLDLFFYNTCSWFRFSVTKSGIKKVVFKGNGNEYVAGTFNVSMGQDDRPTPPVVVNGQTEITLTAPERETLEVGEMYYITLLPGTFDSGFTATFYTTDGEIGSRSINRSTTFKRSVPNTGVDFDKNIVYQRVSVINYTSTGGSVWPNNESGLDAPILASDYDANSGQGSITFSGDLTTIGNNAFAGCRELTSVTVPSTVTTIGDFAFARCSNLESITIPESVTTIGPRAFFNSGLRSISIPKSVTQIGTAALSNCASLASITVDADNTVFDSRNNCNAIIEKTTKTLLFGCSTSTIPNGIVNIGEQAFSYMTGLTSITIPESVTSIGDNAFFSCSKLSQVTSLAIVPPTGNWNIFAQCPIEKIFVRKGAKRQYEEKTPWSKYTIEALSY